MEVKTTKALFAFIVCLFAAAVFVFAAGVLFQYNSGKKNAQNNFRAIVNDTKLVFQDGIENAASVKSGMDAIFDANKNLVAITVRLNDVPVYAHQERVGFITLNQNKEPVIALSSPMITTLKDVFTTRDGRHGITTAAFYALREQTVYNMARVSFLIILAATILAVLFVVANHALQPAAPREAESVRDDAQPEAEMAEEDAQDEEIEQNEELPQTTVQARTEPPAQKKPARSSESDDELDVEPLLSEVERTAGDPGAQSIISPASGFLWEAFLESRLEDELQKAVELEQDLALFIIVLPDLRQNSETAAQIFKLIMNQFRSTDHIFEYKTSCVAAITQNSPIDDSLNQAERLYIKLNEALASSDLSSPRFGIGVTNRTSRIISAQRLIKEADEAAHRALDNPETPIVALKIDPAKYREFLSNADASAGSGSGAYTT